MLIKYSNSSCDQLKTIIIVYHLGVHMCSHLEVLGGTNTAGANSIGFHQDTNYTRCLSSNDTVTATN